MNLRRRGFCSAVAVGATTIASSPAAGQSEIQISGSIDSAVDADVEGVELFFQQVETNSVWTYTVPASGEIDFTVTQSGTHRVRLFNTSSVCVYPGVSTAGTARSREIISLSRATCLSSS